MKRLSLVILLLFVTFAQPADPARADHGPPIRPEEISFEQMLDAQVPLDLAFRDETGSSVRLGQYLGEKPVILLFAYYECPMLCTLVLNDLTRNLKALSLNPGEAFQIITISMNPKETPALAAEKKATYLQEYGRPAAAGNWHFLTGAQPEIERLAETVGFRYRYDPETDQYAHPTGLILLTPLGRVSRYIFGMDYTATDLRLGLLEASERKISSPVDKLFLLCYKYDPVTGRYSLLIQNVLRLAGVATVLILGGFILLLLRRDRFHAAGGDDRRSDPPIAV